MLVWFTRIVDVVLMRVAHLWCFMQCVYVLSVCVGCVELCMFCVLVVSCATHVYILNMVVYTLIMAVRSCIINCCFICWSRDTLLAAWWVAFVLSECVVIICELANALEFSLNLYYCVIVLSFSTMPLWL